MKNVLFWVGGVCGVAAALVVLLREQTRPVETLAHQLEAAWADHHTVA
jgi:hypothetical protein